MNNFLNEHPYGTGEYVHRLLDEKIVMLSQNMSEHISDNDVHVTAEDKERWNSAADSILGSSDPSEEGNTSSSTIIPTKVSDLENDVPYLTSDDMSVYATEEEVRAWLDDYVTKREYDGNNGSGSLNTEQDWIDGDVINRFTLDESIKPIGNNTKGIRLVFDKASNQLRLETIQSYSVNLVLQKTDETPIEYGEYNQPVTVKAVAEFGRNTMDSVTMWNEFDSTEVDVKNTQSHIYEISEMPNHSVIFKVRYKSVTGDEDIVTTSLPVGKKWFIWYSSDNSLSTIPSGATSQVLTSSPKQAESSCSDTEYVYMAFPKEWRVDYENMTFGASRVSFANTGMESNGGPITANGPYGNIDDYDIIRATLQGASGTIYLQ